MTDTATVYVLGDPVDDGEGGFTFETTEETFDCRILSPSESGQLETDMAEILREPGSVIMCYPLSVDLPGTSTIDVTRNATNETERYDVVGLIPEQSHPMQRRAILKIAPSQAES